MTTQRAPFRADQVGSLLRPDDVRDARAKHAAGEITAAALREVEDRAIKRMIARQEAIGLRGITDGECRRAAWTTDFQQELVGVTPKLVEAAAFAGAKPHTTQLMRVTGKLDFAGHSMIEHFKFLKANTHGTPKFTIPAPTMLASASRDWRDIVDKSAYPDIESMFHDLALAYRKAIKAFADAGCTYLQLDDVSLAFICDPKIREQFRSRGDDPDKMLNLWADLINSSLVGKPADMVISTHICRGNFRSSWFSSGGYEPVADVLFNRMNYDAYFMEYDSERAGGFEPLRFMPKNSHKQVVLGLVTSKTPELEDNGVIKKRIEQASAYVDLSRLCLSPQCGFGSTEHGNSLTEEQQWAKLGLCVDIARDVWGSV